MKSFPFTILTVLAAIAAISSVPVYANVTLPNVIASGMVLQRDRPATLWGWAEPGERVTLKLAGKVVAETVGTGAEKPWRVSLPAQTAGPVAELTISGSNTIKLNDVLAGDVWLCSGQSNMVMTVAHGPWCGYGGVQDAEKEIASANDAQLRIFTMNTAGMTARSWINSGTWAGINPESVKAASATAYFFGRELRAKLNVPVGLVVSAVGGTAVEPWTPLNLLENDAPYQELKAKATAIQKELGAKGNADRRAQTEWKKQAAEAQKNKQPVPPAPALQLTPEQGFNFGDSGPILGAGGLYNSKIHALTPMTINGAIWYQGESNARRGEYYAHSLSKMIEGWRGAFSQQFPFLIVQLANFGAPVLNEPHQGCYAKVREAEAKVADTVPGAGVITAVDIGMARNIHPANKQEVGRRLAQLALKQVYGKEVVVSGPVFAGARFEAGKAIVSFKGTGSLTLKGSGSFEVAGADRKFIAATATVHGPTVEVSAPGIAKPAAVRYAYLNNPTCALYNEHGWPALPFRSDDW